MGACRSPWEKLLHQKDYIQLGGPKNESVPNYPHYLDVLYFSITAWPFLAQVGRVPNRKVVIVSLVVVPLCLLVASSSGSFQQDRDNIPNLRELSTLKVQSLERDRCERKHGCNWVPGPNSAKPSDGEGEYPWWVVKRDSWGWSSVLELWLGSQQPEVQSSVRCCTSNSKLGVTKLSPGSPLPY